LFNWRYINIRIHSFIQIRFLPGLCLRPRWGAYSAPSDPYLYSRGLLLRGGGEKRDWNRRDVKEEHGVEGKKRSIGEVK